MSVIAAALKHMLAANMPHDAIIQAVEDMENGLQKDEQAERRRAADRERKKQMRLRNSAESADKADIPRASVTRVEDITLNSEDKQEEKEGKKGATSVVSSGLADFRTALSEVLDPELIATIVQSRRQKRAAINGNTGRLLSKALSQCPNPRAAAEEMVVRGWTTIKPDWLPNAANVRAPPASNIRALPNMGQIFQHVAEADDEPEPRSEARSGPFGTALSYLPAAVKR